MSDRTSHPGPGRPAGRAVNPWLDALRALAIALVLLRHGIRAWPQGAAGSVETFMLNGWMGVDVFFVLSGYLIAAHLIAAGVGTPRFSYARYVRRRAARIVPAYVIAMLVTFALVAWPLNRPVVTLLYHLAFLQDYLPASINVVYWSLGVEAKFYLLAPPLLVLALRVRSTAARWAWMAAALLSPVAMRAVTLAIVGSPVSYETFFRSMRSPAHTSLEPLLLGVAVAIAEHRGAIAGGRAAGTVWLTAGAAALAAWLASHELLRQIGWFDATLQPPGLALAVTAMLIGGVQLSDVTMRGAGVVRAVAVLAYCLYLVHYPLIPLAAAIARGYGDSTAIFWCSYLTLSGAAALVLHLGVERPCVSRWSGSRAA